MPDASPGPIPIYNVMLQAVSESGIHYDLGAENDTFANWVRKGWFKTLGAAKDLMGRTIATTDCSELTQNSTVAAGVTPPLPDGAIFQAQYSLFHGLMIPTNIGMGSYGRLLFNLRDALGNPLSMETIRMWRGGRPSTAHVAFSMGNGTTFEARGSKFLVGVMPVANRGWTHAAEVFNVDYSAFPRKAA